MDAEERARLRADIRMGQYSDDGERSWELLDALDAAEARATELREAVEGLRDRVERKADKTSELHVVYAYDNVSAWISDLLDRFPVDDAAEGATHGQ